MGCAIRTILPAGLPRLIDVDLALKEKAAHVGEKIWPTESACSLCWSAERPARMAQNVISRLPSRRRGLAALARTWHDVSRR